MNSQGRVEVIGVLLGRAMSSEGVVAVVAAEVTFTCRLVD